jgi:hypothetical protein
MTVREFRIFTQFSHSSLQSNISSRLVWTNWEQLDSPDRALRKQLERIVATTDNYRIWCEAASRLDSLEGELRSLMVIASGC